MYRRPEPRLDFHEESHTYRLRLKDRPLDGMRLPSVTEILRPIIPPEVSKYFTPESRDRGRRVHRMIELDVEGRLDVAAMALDDELMSYFEAWMEFRAMANFTPIYVEQPVLSLPSLYAGKLDLYGLLDGKPTLIDVKTGVVDLFVAGPQTAGYLAAATSEIEEVIPRLSRRFVLDLKPRKARLSDELTCKSDRDTFFHCLGVYRHNERRKAA